MSHVLEGSVRKAAGRVRITAQLIDGSNDSHIWAERYDRDLNDIFAIQDEISHGHRRRAEGETSSGGKKGDRTARHREGRRLQFVSDGEKTYATGFEGDARRIEAIIRLCRRAVEIDPNYAQAWAFIGMAEMLLRSASPEAEMAAWLPQNEL